MASRRGSGRKEAGVEIRTAEEWKNEDRTHLVIYGAEGVGKTTLAASFPSPFLIDFREQGSGSIVAHGGGKVPVARVEGWEDIVDVYEYVKAHDELRTVIFDTVTGMADINLGWVMKDEAERDSSKDVLMPQIQDYGKRGDMVKAEILKWLDLPKNIIWIAHEENRSLDRDDPDAEKIIGPAGAPGWTIRLRASNNHVARMVLQRAKVKGEEKLVRVLWFSSRRGNYRAKSRNLQLFEKERIINPTYKKLAPYLP